MHRIQRRTSPGAALRVATAASGCAAASARFFPAGASAARRDGSIHYDLEASGAKLGDAKVWTAGAHPAGSAGRSALVHVGLRVRNASPHRFRLDMAQTGLELVTRAGRLVFVDDAVRVFGESEVEPGRLARFELYFPLPEGLEPEDIAAFDFNWALEIGPERMLTSTTFEAPRRRGAPTPALAPLGPELGLR